MRLFSLCTGWAGLPDAVEASMAQRGLIIVIPSGDAERALINMGLDAYIYGYPLVLMDITRRTGSASILQMNRFLNQQLLATPSFTQVVRPNVDTLYSSAWLDLSCGPLILHVPNTNNRYYLLPMLDAWTNVFASIGARTTGTGEQIFAIVGPGWRNAFLTDIPRIDAPTNIVWVIGRTQTNGLRDYPVVHAIQKGYTVSRPNQPIFPNLDISEEQNIITLEPPKDQIAAMDATAFFNTMMNAMHANPPYAAIQTPEISMQLRALGLIPSNDFDFSKLNPLIQRVLAYAVQNGRREIEVALQELFADNEINGWTMLVENMGSYGTDYLQRAVVAMSLLGANIPEDTVYAHSFGDSYGIPLTGNNDYTIHFDDGQLPPVNAFWSITLYNTDGFLVENPIKRYAISSHDGNLKFNSDSSLNILIQHASPGEEMESNWLPSPEGSFNLSLRMYWPKSPVFNGHWQQPEVAQR